MDLGQNLLDIYYQLLGQFLIAESDFSRYLDFKTAHFSHQSACRTNFILLTLCTLLSDKLYASKFQPIREQKIDIDMEFTLLCIVKLALITSCDYVCLTAD